MKIEVNTVEVIHKIQENGINFSRAYLLTENEHKALLKVESIMDYSYNLENTYCDDSINDYLSECWLNILHESKYGMIKEDVLEKF